jgi:hypothetical protein
MSTPHLHDQGEEVSVQQRSAQANRMVRYLHHRHHHLSFKAMAPEACIVLFPINRCIKQRQQIEKDRSYPFSSDLN